MLHCEAPASDAEDTAMDVCAKLFLAEVEIIAAGRGTKQHHGVKHESSSIHPSVSELHSTSLMELVARGTVCGCIVIVQNDTKTFSLF